MTFIIEEACQKFWYVMSVTLNKQQEGRGTERQLLVQGAW